MFSNKSILVLIFFIFDFIHTAFASAKKGGFVLRDEEYDNGRDVEPAGNQMQLLPQTKEQITEQFKKLIDKWDYNGIVNLGDRMNKTDFSEHLCAVMMTLDHYKNLFECLTDHDIIPDFLAHGNRTLVNEAIVGFPLYPSKCYIHWEDIYNAITMCLNEDLHDSVSSLLEAIRARFVEEDQRLKHEQFDHTFALFNARFFTDYFQGKSSVSLKRFITFHGEELQEKYPIIFNVFFTALLNYLINSIYDPDSRQFHDDLSGQSSPLMPIASAEELLPGEPSDTLQQALIINDWREAVAEGLKKESRHTGKDLWDTIMAKYPGEFPTEFPPSNDTLTAVLEKFKTKQELEDDWTKKNIPMLLEKLETIAFNLPTVLWSIIFGYATITWATTLSWETDNTNEIIEIEDDITLERDPQQGQLTIHKEKQFKELIDRGQYDEIIKLRDNMEISEFLKHICSSMTTLDHLKGLFKYLRNRKILLTFLVYGNATLVEEAIIEFGSPHSAFYIARKLVMKLITFFFNKGIYDRVINILRITKARYMKHCVGMEQSEEMFGDFMTDWFISYYPDENSFPIKHFLTLHGEDFAREHSDVFNAFCQALVGYLNLRLPYPKARSLLVGLVGQPSLLTPVTFVRGFLYEDGGMSCRYIYTYGWREAIEEGLKQEYSCGGERLWDIMTKYFSDEFTGPYPDTDELRAIACAKIETKKEMEDEWIKRNRPRLLKHFEKIAAFLPEASMNIIYEYLTFTWIIN